MKIATDRKVHLDGLRGVAVLCVLAEHFSGMPAKYLDFGYYGVDLFFVLSGFLITGILLRQKSENLYSGLLNFSARRAFRIFPPYFLLLAILFCFDLHDSRRHALALATYTWNYFCFDTGPFYLWSLSVEEQFYVFWPVVILILRKQTWLLCFTVAALCLGSYWLQLFSPVQWLVPYNYTGLPNRMGSLCLGAIGALLVHFKYSPARFMRSGLWEVAAVVGVVYCMLSLRGELGFKSSIHVFPLQGVCSLLLVIKCWDGPPAFKPLANLLGSRWLIQIGIVSYGVYLYHIPIGEPFRNLVFGPLWHSIPFEFIPALAKLRWHSWILAFPCCVLLSYAAASVSWRFFEQPILTWKERFFPRV